MDWKDYIKKLNDIYVGKEVNFEGKKYKVVEVDYNTGVHINRPTKFNKTTVICFGSLKGDIQY